MGTMYYYYPPPPHEGGKLTNRLTRRNFNSASLIRKHADFGYLRVYVVAERYFDSSIGGHPGGGGGAWVYEGRVVCEPYPATVTKQPTAPTIRSVAGWAFSGTVKADDGTEIEFRDSPPSKPAVKDLERAFWDVDAAIYYANGEYGGPIADSTEPVRVSWTKAGYKIRE